jgi:hypothetical protein
MTAAKLLPGVMKCNFESGGDVINTVPIISAAARTITQAMSTVTSNMTDLGTCDFTVILFCCPYTLFYGSGTTNQFPFSTKMGGLSLF